MFQPNSILFPVATSINFTICCWIVFPNSHKTNSFPRMTWTLHCLLLSLRLQLPPTVVINNLKNSPGHVFCQSPRHPLLRTRLLSFITPEARRLTIHLHLRNNSISSKLSTVWEIYVLRPSTKFYWNIFRPSVPPVPFVSSLLLLLLRFHHQFIYYCPIWWLLTWSGGCWPV